MNDKHENKHFFRNPNMQQSRETLTPCASESKVLKQKIEIIINGLRIKDKNKIKSKDFVRDPNKLNLKKDLHTVHHTMVLREKKIIIIDGMRMNDKHKNKHFV